MKTFPVSIMVVGNAMVLCQGQIDKKFKQLLKAYHNHCNETENEVIEPYEEYEDTEEVLYELHSTYYPCFGYAVLALNGTRRSKNYKYAVTEYNETNYNGYKKLLQHVKEFMNNNGENYG